MKSEIADLCLVKYDIKAKFNTFTGTTLPFGNLFITTDAKYVECLANFNTHLYDEFFRDFAMLKDDTTIAYASRDYFKIVLSPEYDTKDEVFALKSSSLNTLWGL